ncbi:GIY-YIG nuclease family protein [Candidatus Uhrbacteria bacterium]|nr:GIY-YIG nuclease family protein [Candidatus Uhrbacteria bacterium]
MPQWNTLECPELEKDAHAVYILECSDSSYYVGSSGNLKVRIQDHNRGKAALWTAARIPLRLIYFEIFGSAVDAKRREAQIKKWSRSKKENLISGVWKQ